jgi:hypothetical protein
MESHLQSIAEADGRLHEAQRLYDKAVEQNAGWEAGSVAVEGR